MGLSGVRISDGQDSYLSISLDVGIGEDQIVHRGSEKPERSCAYEHHRGINHCRYHTLINVNLFRFGDWLDP